VLHCTVVYCTLLHCTVLYCILLHCTALHPSNTRRSEAMEMEIETEMVTGVVRLDVWAKDTASIGQ
jgi:hypothetical protein